MRTLLGLSLLLPIAALAAQSEGSLPTELEINIGHQKVLTVPRVLKVAVGDSAIADLRTLGNDQVLIIGASVGETTLRVWQKESPGPIDIKIRVVKLKPKPSVVPELFTSSELTLKPGEQRILIFPGMLRVAVGDAQILDVKTIGNGQLLLQAGKEAGGTTLIVWSESPRRELTVHVVQ